MINHMYGDQTPKFELQEEKVDITAFRQKDPPLKRPPFNLGKSKFCLKGSHRKPKSPPSKVKIFLEEGSFLVKGCDCKMLQEMSFTMM